MTNSKYDGYIRRHFGCSVEEDLIFQIRTLKEIATEQKRTIEALTSGFEGGSTKAVTTIANLEAMNATLNKSICNLQALNCDLIQRIMDLQEAAKLDQEVISSMANALVKVLRPGNK